MAATGVEEGKGPDADEVDSCLREVLRNNTMMARTKRTELCILEVMTMFPADIAPDERTIASELKKLADRTFGLVKRISGTCSPEIRNEDLCALLCAMEWETGADTLSVLPKAACDIIETTLNLVEKKRWTHGGAHPCFRRIVAVCAALHVCAFRVSGPLGLLVLKAIDEQRGSKAVAVVVAEPEAVGVPVDWPHTGSMNNDKIRESMKEGLGSILDEFVFSKGS
jgi:hypothetical protein